MIVNKIKSSDLRSFSYLLSKCFFHDPLYIWFFYNSKVRFKKSSLFFEFELQKYFDSCYTTDDMSGLIVCKKPTEKLRKNNPIAALKLLFSIGFISAFRAIRYLTVSNRMKRKYMTGDMDYICLICVNETSRGKGIAVKMIEEVCGEKAYLETQNEENIRFYEKLGFCLRETVCISNTSNMLKHYVFIRE